MLLFEVRRTRAAAAPPPPGGPAPRLSSGRSCRHAPGAGEPEAHTRARARLSSSSVPASVRSINIPYFTPAESFPYGSMLRARIV
jgi:hypothetical protein